MFICTDVHPYSLSFVEWIKSNPIESKMLNINEHFIILYASCTHFTSYLYSTFNRMKKKMKEQTSFSIMITDREHFFLQKSLNEFWCIIDFSFLFARVFFILNNKTKLMMLTVCWNEPLNFCKSWLDAFDVNGYSCSSTHQELHTLFHWNILVSPMRFGVIPTIISRREGRTRFLLSQHFYSNRIESVFIADRHIFVEIWPDAVIQMLVIKLKLIWCVVIWGSFFLFSIFSFAF